jgi:hypothetical protein
MNINDLHKSAFRSLGHIYITVNPCVHEMKVYINSGHALSLRTVETFSYTVSKVLYNIQESGIIK